MQINIPIYRAKAKQKVWGGGIEIGDVVSGDLFQEAIDNEDKCSYDYIYFIKQPYGDHFQDIEIDITTLAIHFPDMLDSQGNKIFASLSEDGKGGDIVKYQQVSGGILKSSGPEKCIIKYCNRDHLFAPFFINAKYKNQKTYMTKEHLLVIGIQE